MNKHIQGYPHLVRAAAATDIGRVHSMNEDAYVVAALGEHGAVEMVALTDVALTDEMSFDTSSHPVLLAVSDGMGGHAAGEVASALVVESLRKHLPERSVDWDRALHVAIDRANREIWSAAQRPNGQRMGATLTAACIHGHDVHVAVVGDSRAYLLRNGELQLLTRDTSYVQVLLDAGALSDEEAVQTSRRYIVIEALGQRPDVRVEVGRVRLLGGDTLLVCSDGLSNNVRDEEIRDELLANPSPREACAKLVRLANNHGGLENITVIVAKIA